MAQRNQRLAWLIELVTRDFGFKLLSLGFAVAIWTWVQSDLQVDKRFRARVIYTWPEGLVRVEEVPESLVITVSGPQGLVRTVDQMDLEVPIDLSDRDEGAFDLNFSDYSLVDVSAGLPALLPDGIKVTQMSPPAVEVQLDKRLHREVRIEPETIGDPGEGYRVVSVTTVPEVVRIAGPQSIVKGMNEVRTELIDVTGITTSQARTTPLTIGESMVRAESRAPVEVHIKVEPIVASRTFDAVPVVVRSQGWVTTPATVKLTLEGPQSEVASATPTEVSVLVHLPDPPPEGPVTATFGEEDGPQIEVVHPGDQVLVTAFEPSTLTVEPMK